MNGRLAASALLALVAGATLTGALFIPPALDWPSDPAPPLAGRPVVELNGRVTGIDAAAGVLWLAPTTFGFNARRLTIERTTRILVGAKEGGIGDVPVGARVVAIYEPGPGEPVARWVGINMDPETLRAAALRTVIETPPAEPAPAVERTPQVQPVRRTDSATTPAVASPRPRAPVSQARPTAVTTPARRADTPRPTAERRAAERATPERTPSEGVGRVAPERGASLVLPPRDADDPGAVIDWLLRGAGRN
jgi:hypothetical protein